MAKRPNKRLEDSDQPLPQSPDFGKADRTRPSSRKPSKTSPKLPAPLCQEVTRFAKALREMHGLQDRSAAHRPDAEGLHYPQAGEGQTRQSRSPACGGDATAGD